MTFPWVLSFGVGFLSLSQEILFVRMVSFALGGTPPAFAIVLTLYLLGIAVGAAIGKALCARPGDLYSKSAFVLLLAALTDPLAPLLGSHLGLVPGVGTLTAVGPTLMLVLLAAAIKSVMFPIAHHLGSASTGPGVGRSVARVCFGNILGSTAGPIVTGYVLLEHLSIDRCFQLIGGLSLVLATACILRAERPGRLRQALAVTLVGMLGTAWSIDSGGFVRRVAMSWERVGGSAAAQDRVVHVIENRHGIIHTVGTDGREDDLVFGGNMFDGRISVDLRNDTNGINRVYLLAGLHPAPARILVVGFSGGAWTMAITAFAGVRQIDAIDINHGYVDLIARYATVAPLLADPRVRFHVDDGRRWLRRNPDARFDLIIVNNTQHYRAYATGLLSQEFLVEARRHLAPGGIVAINSTGSLDVALTASRVFEHAYRHASFLILSSQDVRPDAALARSRFEALRPPGQLPLEPSDFEPGGAGARLLNMATRLKSVHDLFAHGPGLARPVTDENLIVEYRHGQRLDVPPIGWLLPAREPARLPD